MITWAICWLIAVIMVNATGRVDIPLGIIIITGVCDIVVVFFVACAVRGWPKFLKEGKLEH